MIRCSKETNASASPVSSSENASARRSIARDSWRVTTPSAALTTAPPASASAGSSGSAEPSRRSARRATARVAAGATSAEEDEQARHVAVAHVRELVRDDRARLGRA